MSQPGNKPPVQIRLDSAEVQPATDPRWRPDVSPTGTLWRRFRGRLRRGRQSSAADDACDLALARQGLMSATEQLLRAHLIPDKEQRRAAILAAAGALAWVSRMVDTVVERRGVEPADCLPRRRARGTTPPER